MAPMALLPSFPTFVSTSPARLKSLYSDFSSQKQLNPAGFQSNVDWWRKTLVHLLRTASQPAPSDVLILHANNALIDCLSSKELGVGKPLGIGSVLTELSTSNAIIPLNNFLSSTESIYYTSSMTRRIASYLVGRPLWWALEQLNIVGETSSESEGQRWKRVQGNYVFVPLLEEAAHILLEHYESLSNQSLADSLFDLDSFRSEFASRVFPGVALTADDMKVLIKFLERDRKVLVTSKDIIKFVNSEDIEESERIITQLDQGVLEMKLAISRLHSQVDDIQRQIEERTSRVMEHLKQKRKEIAMPYLRSRKELENLLSKRLRSLETIQSTLLQVESAAGDIEIMKAYETSTATLTNLLTHPLLQRDKINETMEAMAEASADHAEIDQAIRLGGEAVAAAGGATTIDEDELQKELQQMIEEKEREEAEMKELQELERARKEKAEQEKAEKAVRRQAEERERQRLEEETRERLRQLVEEGRKTPVNEEEDKVWEERWLAAQAEKAAQSVRDREAEVKRRARWEEDATSQLA